MDIIYITFRPAGIDLNCILGQTSHTSLQQKQGSSSAIHFPHTKHSNDVHADFS